MFIIKSRQIILKGIRNITDGLWDMILHIENNRPAIDRKKKLLTIIVHRSKPKFELANFSHACAYSPAIKTFQSAINSNFFATWPGIETLKISKYIHDTLNIGMGDFKRVRQHIQLTKSYETIATILLFTAKEMSYGVLTGAFPYTSSHGNKYLYIFYDYGSNTILVEPMKNRQANTIAQA